jgi:methionyl-tRNA formyltransferase
MMKLRIIFMGTPEFAVSSLQKLVESGCKVVAVVTAPDKPAGRGLQLTPSPVKQYAVSQGIPVLQPEKLKNPDFLAELRSYQADLQVVVAFRMLPEVVWKMPPKGTFNRHASLLPQYRGAAPINWAIMNGETQTGVTTFFLEHEIDTGKIIFQENEPIHADDNVGLLYERLMQKGAELVVRTVKAVEAGEYPQTPQPEVEILKTAPKIFKETCEINWHQPSESIRNFVRGLSPYPAAWTTLNGKLCKIYKTSVVQDFSNENPNAIISDNKTYLRFKTADGWLAIEELQLEGKKRMGIEEFLRGTKLTLNL